MSGNKVEVTSENQTERSATGPSWLDALDDEDLMFVRRFVLASGSLKAVAHSYGISYPTVRLRLDRLIQKIEVLESHRDTSPFERRLRLLYAEGRVDLDTVKTLLREHQSALDTPPALGPRSGEPS